MKTKLKWSWGTGIAIVYSVFALTIIGFVVHSFKQKIDLVTPDYYAKELAYQQQIDKIARARGLEKAIEWKVQNQTIEIMLPEHFIPSRVSGNITLFKPSDNSADRIFPIAIDTSRKQTISTEGLTAGMYKLKIDWQSGDTTYFQEGVIMITI